MGTIQNAQDTFQLGKLYCEKGDFSASLEKLKFCFDLFYEEKKYEELLKTALLMIRIYAEREEFSLIHAIKECLQDLVLNKSLELNSKIYYTLGVCASYKEQMDLASDYMQKAMTMALAKESKEDLCYAIMGIVNLHFIRGNYSDALKEIYNLQFFLESLNLPEIKIASLIVNAQIMAELDKFEQAVDILWQTYDQVRTHKTMTLHIETLYQLGSVYLKSGDCNLAKMYLTLAMRMTDSNNFVHLYKKISDKYEVAKGNEDHNFDLLFDEEGNAAFEKKLGRVEFKNQFILLDLLKLFTQGQGKVYSKEFLVEHVWKQDYNPGVHDNKLYVTIKRLRKMIEPDYNKPKYIFRAKNGYFMNKAVKVLIQSKGGGKS